MSIGTTSKFRVWWWPLIIAGAGLLAYAGSFGAPFIFDDNAVIPRMVARNRWWTSIPAPRCLVDLSFRLHSLAGHQIPADYRLVNVVLHVLAALLLFGVVRRTLGRLFATGRCRLDPSMGAGFIALLWCLHPVQTESVTYVSQRYESLMGMFFLLSFYGLVRSVEGLRARFWGNVSLAACVGAMASKENAVVLPVLLFLFDGSLLSDGYLDAWRRRWRLHLGYVLTWGILATLMVSLWRAGLQGPTMVTGGNSGTSWQYWMTQPSILAHYLRLAVVPWPLCFDYGWVPETQWQRVVLPGLAIGGTGLACLWGIVRRSGWGFLGAWFFGILAPTAIIVMPDLVFEHRLYLPLAAVIVAAVVAFRHALFRGERRGWWSGRSAAVAGMGAGVAVALGFLAMTVARNRDYRSEESLWKSVLRCRPDNLRAQLGLGVSYLRDGRLDDAARLFANIVDATEARKGALGADDRTQRCLALNNMGVVREQEGRYAEAAGYFRRAVETSSSFMDGKSNLAVALAALGQVEEACRLWREVIAATPSHAPTHHRLGHWLGQGGDYRGAIRHLAVAVSLSRDLVPARLELAWWLSVAPDPGLRDGRRALELAQGVAEETGGESARVQEVLAAAYAESGDFEFALVHANRALKLVTTAGWGGAEIIEKRIESYREGKPWREPL